MVVHHTNLHKLHFRSVIEEEYHSCEMDAANLSLSNPKSFVLSLVACRRLVRLHKQSEDETMMLGELTKRNDTRIFVSFYRGISIRIQIQIYRARFGDRAMRLRLSLRFGLGFGSEPGFSERGS